MTQAGETRHKKASRPPTYMVPVCCPSIKEGSEHTRRGDKSQGGESGHMEGSHDTGKGVRTQGGSHDTRKGVRTNGGS